MNTLSEEVIASVPHLRGCSQKCAHEAHTFAPSLASDNQSSVLGASIWIVGLLRVPGCMNTGSAFLDVLTSPFGPEVECRRHLPRAAVQAFETSSGPVSAQSCPKQTPTAKA
eukprot:980362-Amphidinium_carterae.1